MTLLFILYLVTPVVLAGLLYIMGVRSRRTLIITPLILFLLPFLAGALLYLFRTPIQQGKILHDMGPLLNLVFPADDLYDPRATVELEPGINDYVFNFSHKYVGRHSVEISSPREIQDPKSRIQDQGTGYTNGSRRGLPGSGTGHDVEDLRVVLEVYQDGRVLYYAEQSRGSKFWGRDDYGLHFNSYRAPRHLPLAEELTARVTITGDVDGYLSKHGKAFLSITKMSDE